MIVCKPTVRFQILLPEIYNLFSKLDNLFNVIGKNCVITSANDGQHSDRSLHYTNKAIDCRSKHLVQNEKDTLLRQMRAGLGKDYDVILEDIDKDNEHYHIEFDPKES